MESMCSGGSLAFAALGRAKKGATVMRRLLLLAALVVACFAGQAQAQYYGYPVPYYDYYPGPIALNANQYINQGMYNTRQFYNLGSANNYLRGGLNNAGYFYGL
jgi:hypothetical protein